MKRKLCLFGAAALLSVLIVSCAEMANFSKGFLDGYDAGSQGYSLLGNSSSASSCASACQARGYKYYRYNSSTELCYCK